MMSRSQIRKIMTRLKGRDFGDKLRKDKVTTDILLNTEFETLQQFINFSVFCGVQDVPIVHLAIQTMRDVGRNKAFSEADILTQLAAYTAEETKPKAAGYGADDNLFDTYEES